MSRYSGQQDVVFGVTVSGRPPELEGVEGMVGVFINTLPVRVRVTPEMPVTDWLWRLQKEQAESRKYEYSPLSRVQGWSEVKRGSPLFQSIVVFENFPAPTSSSLPTNQAEPGGWNIRYLILVKENYPLTLAADPGAQLLLEIKYDTSLFEAATIGHMSNHLETLLNALSQSDVWQQTLGDVLERTHAEQQVNDERKVKEVRSQLLKQVKRKVVTGAA
jgi:non-ribosomal peptide synthetase component F